MTTYCYVRCSTQEQDEDGRRLGGWLRERGYYTC